MHRRAAGFLDLNGTLAEPVEVERLADLTMIEGAAAAVGLLCRAGFLWPGYAAAGRDSTGAIPLATYTAESLQQVAEWIVRQPAAGVAAGADPASRIDL